MHLAWYLSPVERRGFGELGGVRWQRVDIDRVELLVPSEEPLPERVQGQRALGQEHERYLGDPLERIILHLGDQRGPPEELLVRHVVHEVPRRPDPEIEGAGLAQAGEEAEASLDPKEPGH